MLHYPKIPGSSAAPQGRCVAFEKLDGTNLHWGWDRDFGWHAFGTRRDESNLTPDGVAAFAATHPGLEDAAPTFLETLAAPLDHVLRTHPGDSAGCEFKAFTEFLGPHSFAGAHRPDDPKRVVLFDVWAGGHGFIGPERFVAAFGHLPTPRVVYRGRLTGAFLEAVREGRYGVAEGVVCKGGDGETAWMVKVKTYHYQDRLRAAFADRWGDFWERVDTRVPGVSGQRGEPESNRLAVPPLTALEAADAASRESEFSSPFPLGLPSRPGYASARFVGDRPVVLPPLL